MDKTKEIKGLKLTFSRIGVHSITQPERRVVWMVGMDIVYEDGSRNKVPLLSYPMVSTAEKKKINVSATTTGFVIATPGEERSYHFYNAAGEATGQLPVAEVGELVQIDERAVVFRMGDHVRFYGLDSTLIGERDLTAEEIAALSDES